MSFQSTNFTNIGFFFFFGGLTNLVGKSVVILYFVYYLRLNYFLHVYLLVLFPLGVTVLLSFMVKLWWGRVTPTFQTLKGTRKRMQNLKHDLYWLLNSWLLALTSPLKVVNALPSPTNQQNGPSSWGGPRNRKPLRGHVAVLALTLHGLPASVVGIDGASILELISLMWATFVQVL